MGCSQRVALREPLTGPTDSLHRTRRPFGVTGFSQVPRAFARPVSPVRRLGPYHSRRRRTNNPGLAADGGATDFGSAVMAAAAQHLRSAGSACAAASACSREAHGAGGQGERALDVQTRSHPGEVVACLGFRSDLGRFNRLRLLLPGRRSGHVRSRALNPSQSLSAVGAKRIRLRRRAGNRRHPSRPGDVPRDAQRRGCGIPSYAWRRDPGKVAALLSVRGDLISHYREHKDQTNAPGVSHRSTHPLRDSS